MPREGVERVETKGEGESHGCKEVNSKVHFPIYMVHWNQPIST